MPSNKVPLARSHRDIPPGSKVVGSCSDDELMKITVVLRRRAPLPPPSATAAPPLSREEFAQTYGADPADIQKVEEFASANGLTVGSTDVGRRTVVLSGTAGAMKKAFDVNLVMVQQADHTYRARSGMIYVPAALQPIVEAVLGLDNRPQARSRFRIIPRAQADVSYTPVQVAKFYNFPSKANGAGQTIGIIELGGGYNDSDLSSYFSGLGISPAPTVIAASVDGATNQPAGDPNSADGEVLLDIEIAGAVAPGAAIVAYFAPNTDQGFLDAITTAVHDAANKPSVISISWGSAEANWTQQSLHSFDQAFQDAGTLGVTICAAAGDGGSSDGQTDGLAHVDFPASSPNALACGGTRLDSSNGKIQDEVVWNDGSDQGATGGGVSEVFALPGYQSSAGVPVSVNSSQYAGRGVPDVAGDADPATGYQIFVDGQSLVVGGTSAVAPLWAGLIALLNQQLGKPLGFTNPGLYGIPASSGAFNDITSGNNGAYSAGPGWDACTGLGSPSGSALQTALGAPGA